MSIAYPLCAEGATARVIESGSGNANLLFLHGAGARADRWRKNLDVFAAAGWHCYAVDLPGHGFASKGGNIRFQLEALRSYLTSIVEGLGLERYGVIGTSLGGLLAADLALSQADQVDSLTMVGSLGLEPLSEAVRSKIASNIQIHNRDQARSKLQSVVFDTSSVTEEWVEEEFRINTSPGAPESLEALGREFLNPAGVGSITLTQQLAKRVTEGLLLTFIWGRDDRSVSVDIGRRTSKSIEKANWLEIGNACHAPYFEKPEEFNAALLGFLQPTKR